MQRARVLFAPLIPALWLVTSVSCPFDPMTGGAISRPVFLLSSGGPHQRDASHAAGLLDQAAHRWARRLDQPSGPGTPPPAAPSHGPGVSRTLALEGALAPHSLLGLAQGWQFHWRTALEPRAPSSVS